MGSLRLINFYFQQHFATRPTGCSRIHLKGAIHLFPLVSSWAQSELNEWEGVTGVGRLGVGNGERPRESQLGLVTPVVFGKLVSQNNIII